MEYHYTRTYTILHQNLTLNLLKLVLWESLPKLITI